MKEGFFFPLKVLRAFLLLNKLKPQAIHVQGGMYSYVLAGYFFKKIHPTTLLYTFHTSPVPGEKLPALTRMSLQKILNRCDCVTFVSKALEGQIRDGWGLQFERSAVTYGGVRPECVSPDEASQFRRDWGLAEDDKVLLALGLTALNYKAEGLKLLIKSIKMVRLRYPNVILMATKAGVFLDDLRRFAEEEDMKDNVIFTGDIKEPYVAIAACDIYVHISFGEGLPLSLLESMSMGKPIIATPAGGIPEAIEDRKNGLLVNPTAEDIADKITYLLDNQSAAAALGRNAKLTADYAFTWSRSADEFLRIYRGVQQ